MAKDAGGLGSLEQAHLRGGVPGRNGAHGACLHHRDGHAGAREEQSGRQSGQPCPRHDDVEASAGFELVGHDGRARVSRCALSLIEPQWRFHAAHGSAVLPLLLRLSATGQESSRGTLMNTPDPMSTSAATHWLATQPWPLSSITQAGFQMTTISTSPISHHHAAPCQAKNATIAARMHTPKRMYR